MSCPSLLGAAVSRVPTADTGTGATVKLKRGSVVSTADGPVTPIIRRLSSTATAASCAPLNVSTDTLPAPRTPPRGGRNSHPATPGHQCPAWLKTRTSQSVARRTRRAAQAPDGQGPARAARQPKSWVQSDLPSLTAAQLRKPGLPKAYKPIGREHCSAMFNIAQQNPVLMRSSTDAPLYR